MRKYTGFMVMLFLWIALTIGGNVWFGTHTEVSIGNLLISAGYMLFLLLILPVGLPLHSRGLEILLMVYAFALGALDVAVFLHYDNLLVNWVGNALLAPFRGLFYFEGHLPMGSFAIYALIGFFAAFLVFAAGICACMVQERE